MFVHLPLKIPLKMATFLIRNGLFHLQKRFLQSSAPLSPIPPLPTSATSNTVQFLVDSCRLPLESALSVSHKFQLTRNSQKAQSVLNFLKSHHFSDKQIARLIEKWPQILQCRVKNNLRPKFDYLRANGFVGKVLPQFLVLSPQIVRVSLDSQIKGCFQLLRSVLYRDDKIVAALKTSPWLLVSNHKSRLQKNIDILKEGGISADNLGKFFTMEPRCMLKKPERMVYVLNFIKNLGFQPDSPMFLHALRVKLSMSESTWKKKLELMKSMGWNEHDVLKAFKRFPACFKYSEKKLRNALDFYLNTLKLEPENVIADPQLLGYSIEKRVIPRYNALKVLESKKLVEGIDSTILYRLDEIRFRRKYVDRYENEVPGLLEMYLRSKEAKKVNA